MSLQVCCTVCFKKFRNPQNLRAHNQFGDCKKKSMKELENENASLEKAIVIEDDKEVVSAPQSRDIGTIKKQSVDMIKQLDSIIELTDNDFNELENKLSFEAGAPQTTFQPVLGRRTWGSRGQGQGVFKAPGPPPAKKRKRAVDGQLTGRACHYCPLEQPDWITLALHYVREHWEDVRRRQWGQGPKSKFHNQDLQDDRTIIPPPPPRPSATAMRHQVSPYSPLCSSCLNNSIATLFNVFQAALAAADRARTSNTAAAMAYRRAQAGGLGKNLVSLLILLLLLILVNLVLRIVLSVFL